MCDALFRLPESCGHPGSKPIQKNSHVIQQGCDPFAWLDQHCGFHIRPTSAAIAIPSCHAMPAVLKISAVSSSRQHPGVVTRDFVDRTKTERPLPHMRYPGIFLFLIAATLGTTHGQTASAITDGASIQEALEAQPGRMVYVPAGDYEISEPIQITHNNAGLFGPGRIIQTNPNAKILSIQGASGVQIRNLTLTRPEGQQDCEAEAVDVKDCRNLVLSDLQIIDNRARSAAVSLMGCVEPQILNCLIENYMRIAIDDRTSSENYGYAFYCIDGTGIAVRTTEGLLLQGNRVIERNLLPTPEIKEKYKLGQFAKKNAEKGTLIPQKTWDAEYVNNWHQGSAIWVSSPESTCRSRILGNYIENAAQGMDIHSDQVIISQNIINNAFWGLKVYHGSRCVIITDNQITKSDLWGIHIGPGTASHAAGEHAVDSDVENGDGQVIVANNIISDFGSGNAAWIWGNSGAPMKFAAGPLDYTPPLQDAIVEGNIVQDAGREKVLVDGKYQVVPPRYKFAVIIESGDKGPQNLHFANNIFHPGTGGISNIELTP